MNVLIICSIVRTDPLLDIFYEFSDMKKCPPALLRALVYDIYDTLLWTAMIMSLDLNVTMASGCVAA